MVRPPAMTRRCIASRPTARSSRRSTSSRRSSTAPPTSEPSRRPTPLGTGLVTTAIKRGLCPPALEREAIAVMTTLNREASEAMVAAGATAATDVTGYGLIGHLANLKGGADLDLGATPFIDGVRQLAERDLFPDGSRRNHAAYRDRVDWGGTGELDQMMLCDAQTSGGLLVAIPPQN